MTRENLVRYSGVLLLLLLINTAYIAAFTSPTIFYMGNVVLHLALGAALGIMLLWSIRRMPVAGSLFLIAALAGVFLAVRGNTTPHRWVLEAHIAVAALERARRVMGRDLQPQEIVVIGDTPFDVRCGKFIGAKTLAVATGGAKLDELKPLKPDWAVADLTHITAREICGR